MTLRSDKFDDIYFSVDDGMAETDYVFIKGCKLPDAWQGKSHFTIFETGFGTGLNCLRAASLFEQTTKDKNQTLDIISIEKYPLSKDDIMNALSPWATDLNPFLSNLIENYPLRINTIHPISLSPHITLHLCFGDIQDILPKLLPNKELNIPAPHRPHKKSIYTPIDTYVDAWFLDGFAPSKNPDMWCNDLFRAIKQYSHSNTRLATFTAAGIVRRGLESANLTVEKTKGFGRKRDMLIAYGNDSFAPMALNNITPTKPTERKNNIAIIGAGLAGSAMSYRLKERGLAHQIFETAPICAFGASGNPLGLITPKLSALPTPESDFYSTAYALMLKTAQHINSQGIDIEFNPCGSLNLKTTDDKARRFKGYLENLGWHSDHMRALSSKEISDLAAIQSSYEGIHYPDSASINPAKLCAHYLNESDVHYDCTITDALHDGTEWILTDQRGQTYTAQHLVIACADGALRLNVSKDLPIHTVRGQLSLAYDQKKLENLTSLMSFGGYLSPYNAALGGHVLGASYKKWDETTTLQDEDDQMNIDRLEGSLPDLLDHTKVKSLRASLRLTSKSHFPIIGSATAKTTDHDNNPTDASLYYSLAHGSHGIVSSLYAAHIITAQIEDRFAPAYSDIIRKLSS